MVNCHIEAFRSLNAFLFSLGNQCQKILDFEDAGQQKCLFVPGNSNGQRSFSTFKAKHGIKSLKWESVAMATSKLRYKRPSAFPAITGSQLRKGGIKMWIYKETPSNGKEMDVRLRDTRKVGGKKKSILVGEFPVNLGFKGWRGIWMAYSEFTKSWNRQVTVVEKSIRKPSTSIGFSLRKACLGNLETQLFPLLPTLDQGTTQATFGNKVIAGVSKHQLLFPRASILRRP